MRRRIITWLAVFMGGLLVVVVLMNYDSWTLPRTKGVVNPVSPSAHEFKAREETKQQRTSEFAASNRGASPVDNEVQSVLRHAGGNAKGSPRWGPDLSKNAEHRQTFSTAIASWGPEHYAAILHFLVTLDPSLEENANLFVHAAQTCMKIAKQLGEEKSAVIADAYRSSRYIDWLETAMSKQRGVHYSSSPHLKDIALLGIKVGGVDREPLLLRILARVQTVGWGTDDYAWYRNVDQAEPQTPPSSVVVKAFQETIERVAKNPAISASALSEPELGAEYIRGWLRAKDPEMKSSMLRWYLALPAELRDISPGSVMMPPAHNEFYNMISARPAGSMHAPAIAFIMAVQAETEKFDDEFAALLSQYTGPTLTFAQKLLQEELRGSFRTKLEAALQRHKN